MTGIKNMEFPESCSKCKLSNYILDEDGIVHAICNFTHVDISKAYRYGGRGDDCPLINLEKED